MEFSKEIAGKYGTLRGVIHKSNLKECFGCIIIIHGYFSSTKLGPARLYVQLARIFADNGYETWRFDSFGVGDSDGKFIESTPHSRMSDFEIIIREAKKNNSTVTLLGHSMGTSMALRIASKTNVSSLFLLSPSFGKLTWKKNLFNDTQLGQLSEKGKTKRKSLEVNQEFMQFLEDEEVIELSNSYENKVIMVYGLEDEFYSSEAIKLVKARFKNSELIEIEGGDHNFINNKSREIIIEKMKNGCQQWLKRQ